MRKNPTLLALGFASTIAQVIPWKSDLSCGACAIGGFKFCYTGSKGECCKLDDKTCQGKYNKCTEDDKFAAVYSTCDNSAFRNKDICGNPNVRHVDNTSSSEIFNIANMPIGESCTYKVFSKCSWPKFEVNTTEVGLWVTSFKGKPSDTPGNDDPAVFTPAKKDGNKLVAEPDNSNKTTDCNSQIRMYVTLARY